MDTAPHDFNESVRAALVDPNLQRGLREGPPTLAANRAIARAKLPEFEALRTAGRDIKDHVLANLDAYLETFEANAKAAGSQVHFAATADEARAIILGICRDANAKLVTKGKSMVTEEIDLNPFLQNAGLEVVETDLGEYLVQIRGERPSHIIAPAIHMTQAMVEADFRRVHAHLPQDRNLSEAELMVDEARGILRGKYLAADVGITGANFMVAETGSTVIVTNEGNGDLTQSLARVHVVMATIEKIVPTLADLATFVRLLARSATGQEISAYTTLSTGPRRPGDPDGPEACHIVILDNGRTDILKSELREVLRCIRCGACMNHCPVYRAIGGHAYGSVYPGPIGSVLTPALGGVGAHHDLPSASTFCGRCAEVCPMQIPLPDLMRKHREAGFDQHLVPWGARAGLALWGAAARRPRLYHALTRFMAMGARVMAMGRGAIRSLPVGRGWTRHRDFPTPEGRTFQQLWAESERGVPEL